MIRTSEYCAAGHPDRTCDLIASWLLDTFLERDENARVALEVQLKDQYCTVSGEVSTLDPFRLSELDAQVRRAVRCVGYTDEYAWRFGADNVAGADDLQIAFHLSQQSPDIAQGVDGGGWGDQGVFFGMAVDSPDTAYLPKDYWLSRTLANDLYDRRIGGIDIKTMVTVEDGDPTECVVAIPLLPDEEKDAKEAVLDVVRSYVGTGCKVIVNGTGRYVRHGSVGDCGTTGRKLVADFYGSGCQIGGGSCWGKDPSKADVTLNVYARHLAMRKMKDLKLPFVRTAISCCIGRKEIRVSYFDGANNLLSTETESRLPGEVINDLGLRKPVFFGRCLKGQFGEND